MATASIRFSQFNASLNRSSEGQLVTDLSTPNNAQAKAVAEIIQRNNPDVLLINEFDYVAANPLQPVQLLQQNYFGVSQNGAAPVNYPYVYIAPSNTGISSGFDLNNNGVAVTAVGTSGYGDDSFGFGNFPGQFGMLILSKYEIDTANIRTFQNFLWKDMPNSLLTNDPTVDNPTTAVNENLNGFYSPEEIAVLRLSSKSHWDVPVKINGETVHLLVSHPTPPTFDGTEDRNGKRNADEIRFWADYITPGKGDYIYDDNGNRGGIANGSSFVIMGDQNADPLDGDSFNNAIRQLLLNPNINTNSTPSSLGASQQATLQGSVNNNHKGNPAFDTADFNDNPAPGNLRTDYVLPSTDLQVTNSAVYWPLNSDPNFAPVGTFPFPSSDHRLIYADVQVGATPAGTTVTGATLLGNTTFSTGFVPTGAAAQINGVDVAVGGLSSVTYDAVNNRYYAISDDRSSNARFYTFTIDPVTNAVTFTNVVQLKDANGNPFATNSLDPEGIALTSNGTVFISSEGEVRPDLGATRVTDPFIKEFSLTTGQELRSLPVPKKFVPVVQDTNTTGVVDAGDTQTSGVFNNLSFESLTIAPNQKMLYTATENALFQDGLPATVNNGSRSRIVQYNLVSGQPDKEYLYVTDPVAIPPNPANQFATNGLVDLLAIDDRGTLLAVERSFATGAVGTVNNTGNTIKIYEISLQGVTDISTTDSLSSMTTEQLAAIAPVQKRLVLNLDDLNLPTGTDNIEGITFGPKLADGRQSIVLVSDNNFSATQFTQILTLSADVVPTVAPTVETRPALLDDDNLPFSQRADADDPAIYVNASDSAKSLFVTSVKNGGLRIYDLAGNLLQTINPSNPDIRYNNVDLQYGFTLGGQKVDIAVASDRNNDKLAIFKIDANGIGGNYLTDITDSSAATIFQGAPFTGEFDPGSISAYGLTIYRSPVTQDYYVFTSRRETGDIAQLKLVDKGNGKIGYQLVRNFTVPTIDGRDPQTEGMVVDQETGFLYIGQENVGIWKYEAEPNSSNVGILIDKVKSLGGKNLIDDVEGLTIYYGEDGAGYLFASSQGDNTFATYSREGNNDFIGRFAIGNNGAIDSVQESDGADVINVPLGANFPFGAFITQDGSNDPAVLVEDDGELENISSNFKIVPFENIANAFATPLKIDTTSYDPRNPIANSLINGVASGDTTQTSTVLWTRSTFTGDVKFEYSTKSDFSVIAGTKTATVTNSAQPAKVQIEGLTANTEYFYRVTDAAGDTAIGRFVTAAALGKTTGLTFGVSGDWQQAPPYPILTSAAESKLDFFVKLGDTIYADLETPALPGVTQARTLQDFRTKHSEVLSPRFGLSATSDLYQSTSILASIDDHEIVDNFAGGAAPGKSPDAPDIGSSDQPLFTDAVDFVNDTQVYEDALQAYQEYHPLRDEFYNTPNDPRTDGERKLYRANQYGSDAAVFVLDSRSFRDAQIAPANLSNPTEFLVNAFDPSRTLLGKVQLNQVKADLLKAHKDGTTWKFVLIPEPIQNFGVVNAEDRFEGYAAERTELLSFIDQNKISNVVFMAGDFHGTIVNNLTYQTAPGQAQIATDAFEVVTGPVAFFDGRFGPNVANISAAAGFITQEQLQAYNSLPVAPDLDDIVNDKDDFVKQLLVGQTNLLGYDPVGLNNNLASANGLIDATLLQGDYVAAHNYSWTEFDIDATTQALTVTTFGIDAYSEAEVLADPQKVLNLEPRIISQFRVNPKAVPLEPALVSVGTQGNDLLIGGLDINAKSNIVFTGAGNDEVDLVPVANVFGANSNRFDLGSGNDKIFVNKGDVAFGGSGNDIFEATESTGSNRMSGGAGDDTFFLGAGDRALGGDGNDQFFVSTGGNNLLSGGAGSDIFHIITAGTIPSAPNTIIDFQIGTDSLGMSGYAFGDLIFSGNQIKIGSNEIATLTGVDTSTLTAANFNFK